jgi:hypothetical protein
MKISPLWILACTATVLSAGELDPRLLRLIGPDTTYVSGGDVERFQASKIGALGFGRVYVDGPTPRFRLEIGMPEGRALYVTVGATPVAVPDTDAPPESYRGARIWKDQGTNHALLDSAIEMHGDEKAVTDAIDRWRNATAALSPLALTARRLSNSYDAWYVVTKPLGLAEFAGRGTRSPRVEELTQAIDELRAGIRLGSIDEADVEIDCKSSDEATAIAVFGHYLPALLETKPDPECLVFQVADHVVSRAQGRTAILSLTVDENRLEEAMHKRAQRIYE